MAAGGNRQRGFSIVEVMAVLLLLTVAMAVIYEMMISASRAGMFSESRNDLTLISERSVNTIQTEISQSKLIFEENAIGTGYRTLFTAGMPAGITVTANSRMPIIDSASSTLGVDPGPNGIVNRTGNSLILARQLAPVSVPYDHDANAGTPDVNFLADRYQFQFYFLWRNPARSFGNFGYYLDLIQAKSEIVADYVQLSSVTTNRAQLVSRLNAATGIALAWDPGKTVPTAFYTVNGAGTLPTTTPARFTVTTKSLCPEFAGGRVSGKMEYSVCLNSNTPIKILDPVPMFATVNANFPGGLEFQIVGPSGARKIMARLVTASWYSSQYASQAAYVVTSSHGF
jgi:prepilin-type N-terminal cleavage/methylation domain-containing protein